jgi:hypothetical protein
MTLREAMAGFLERPGQKEFSVKDSLRSFALLTACFPPDIALDEITPAGLRDFLARWYVEEASSTSQGTSDPDSTGRAIEPQSLCDSLAEFFRWAAGFEGAEKHLLVLAELKHSLPRALEVTASLSKRLSGRGGAFAFPEFLTSFEEGGHSSYDLGDAGESGAVEGYFRITRVEGAMVEAEDMITGERVWPIIFPRDLAALLADDYVINLELVRGKDGWQIAACGFTYPPGTDV